MPGVTTHYGDLAFAGDGSHALLFGVFRVSVLHDLVHVAIGVAGLGLARTLDGARTYLLGAGVAFLLLWLLAMIDKLDWLPTNSDANWLHFALGIAFLGLGFVTARPRE